MSEAGHYRFGGWRKLLMRSRYLAPIQALSAVIMAASLAGCATLAAQSTGQRNEPSPPADLLAATPPSASALAPTPTPSPSPSPVASAQSQPPMQPVKPVAWQVRVNLTTFTRVDHTLTVAVVDSRGIEQVGDREFGSFDLTVTLVVNANPCCSIGPNPTPTPGPTTYVQHYVGCCTPEYMPVNMAFGGTWAIRGTVTWEGQTKPVSASGTIPWP